MPVKQWLSLALCGALVMAAGCKKNSVDKSAFKSAINTYYLSTPPECIWPEAKKFPTQADTSNDSQTAGYDALTDAGFLVRKSAEKKRFLIGSKQVNDYDLSDKGRSVWTADPTQPGYGNFCYGHPEVTMIDNFTPADTPDATQYSVHYHYDVVSVPAWASTTEMQTAFPEIAAEISGRQMAVANLVKSGNGWQVSSLQPSRDVPPPPQ